MKRTAVTLLLALALGALSPAWASHRGGRPPRPPHHGHYDPSLNIWVDIGEYEDDEYETGKLSREDADGVVTVVSSSPGRWLTDVDIGMNAFEMIAPLSLPPTVKSRDIAGMRAIFNDSVDRKTVDTTVDDRFETLTASGRLVRGGAFGRVELIQIIVETMDGRVLIQDISVGLDIW